MMRRGKYHLNGGTGARTVDSAINYPGKTSVTQMSSLTRSMRFKSNRAHAVLPRSRAKTHLSIEHLQTTTNNPGSYIAIDIPHQQEREQKCSDGTDVLPEDNYNARPPVRSGVWGRLSAIICSYFISSKRRHTRSRLGTLELKRQSKLPTTTDTLGRQGNDEKIAPLCAAHDAKRASLQWILDC
jgi:hypothetical protein